MAAQYFLVHYRVSWWGCSMTVMKW